MAQVLATSAVGVRATTTSGDLTVTVPTGWTVGANQRLVVVFGALSQTIDTVAPTDGGAFSVDHATVRNQWGSFITVYGRATVSGDPGRVITLPYTGAVQARVGVAYVLGQVGATAGADPSGTSASNGTVTFTGFTATNGDVHVLAAAIARASVSAQPITFGNLAGYGNLATGGTTETAITNYRNGSLLTAWRADDATVTNATVTVTPSSDWASIHMAYLSSGPAPVSNQWSERRATRISALAGSLLTAPAGSGVTVFERVAGQGEWYAVHPPSPHGDVALTLRSPDSSDTDTITILASDSTGEFVQPSYAIEVGA